jgi:hypothetical protein
MTPSGMEPATFRFVAQHLNHCATAAPDRITESNIIIRTGTNHILRSTEFCVQEEAGSPEKHVV